MIKGDPIEVCQCCDINQAVATLELNGDVLCQECYDHAIKVIDKLKKQMRRKS